MKNFLISLTFICLVSSIKAQTSKDSITSAVKDYVDAFYFGDTSKIYNSISSEVVKYGYYRPKEKTTYAGEPMSFREMIDYSASVKKRGVSPNVNNFPKKIEILDAMDQTASTKLTAWWGTDYILLSKINNKWIITHVLWQSAPVRR